MAKPLKTKEELKAATLKELEEEEKKQKKAEQTAKTSASSAAAKNKTGSSGKTNLGTSKQAAGDLIAKAAGAQSGIDKIEEEKKEKAAQQARENKEKDLPGFDGYAYQQQLAQQKEEEKIEYLNVKEARDKKSALEQELSELKNQAKEKEMIDEIRCRNSNLEISCGRLTDGAESL